MTSKNKILKVLNITGAILLVEIIVATGLRAWGFDISFKVVTYTSYIWIPIALLVWRKKP